MARHGNLVEKTFPASAQLRALFADYEAALKAAASPFVGDLFGIPASAAYNLAGASAEVDRVLAKIGESEVHHSFSRDGDRMLIHEVWWRDGAARAA